MNFNSLQYLAFLPCAALVYWLIPQKGRNPFLLILSYAFYMSWRPVFAAFLLFVTVLTYCSAICIARFSCKKCLIAALTVIIGFAPLVVCKYLGFFTGLFSPELSKRFSDIILPIGISFFSFQAIGYTIDVYRGSIPCEKSFLTYALFVSFFPQISSGPIGRAAQLIPQLKQERHFSWDQITDGTVIFVWGAFKKIVVADNLAVIVNAAFSNPTAYSGWTLLIAAICFSVQIYCDFSGYSDMAIGSARFFGIHLMRNFDAPYLSRSVKEFWRRWHISLSTWFRDYLYIPLGGSRKGTVRTILNILIVFAVSGMWHGAAATFIVWGLLNGLFQVFGMVMSRPRQAVKNILKLKDESIVLIVWQTVLTFALMTAAWVFFKANTIADAVFIIKRILLAFIGRPQVAFSVESLTLSIRELWLMGICIAVLLLSDIFRKPIGKAVHNSVAVRTAVLFVLIAVIFLFGSYGSGYDPQDFVYFKF